MSRLLILCIRFYQIFISPAETADLQVLSYNVQRMLIEAIQKRVL